MSKVDRAGVVQRISAVLPLALGVIAFGVPVLYTLGRVYTESYWDELQLPSSVVSYGVEDYVYLGFVAIFNAVARSFSSAGNGTLRYLLVVTAAVVAIALYWVALDKWAAPTLKRQAQRVRAWLSTTKIPNRHWLVDTAKVASGLWLLGSVFVIAFAIAFFFVALPLAGVYQAGKLQAKRDQSKLLAVGEVPTKYGARPVLHYRDGFGVGKASLLLQCTDQWCVAYEGGFFAAIKADAVERIDHCPKYVQLQNGVAACADVNEEPPQAKGAAAGAGSGSN